MNNIWQDKEKRKVLLASVGLVLGLVLLMVQMGVFSGGGGGGEEESGTEEVVNPADLPSSGGDLPGVAGAPTPGAPPMGYPGASGPMAGPSAYPGAAMPGAADAAAAAGGTGGSLKDVREAIAKAKTPPVVHRPDPFSPLVTPPKPPAPVLAVAALLPDLSIWKPKPPAGPKPIGDVANAAEAAAEAATPEPQRRMVGLMSGRNKAFAILEQDGAQAVVWPGAVLPDRRTRVERIEPDRLVLRNVITGRTQFVPLEGVATATGGGPTPGYPGAGPGRMPYGPYGAPGGPRPGPVPGGYGPPPVPRR